jgi:hypothetical protein
LPHTLSVNDVGISFAVAARKREGDVCGPLAWRHEIAHPIGPPPGRKRPEQLIADAVLTYERRKPSGAIRLEYRFVELDRNTMPTALLAGKLARYARLYRHTVKSPDGPVAYWQTRYPVFPTVLLVLDNGTTRQLERRARTVLGLCAEHPELRSTPEVEISCCSLSDLQDSGPFASIWRTIHDPSQPVDWLGNRKERGHDR